MIILAQINADGRDFLNNKFRSNAKFQKKSKIFEMNFAILNRRYHLRLSARICVLIKV
jgi:hypothetical protein